MKTAFLTTAELTAKMEASRGAKRRKIIQELQKRWDEVTPRNQDTWLASSIPRYNFEAQHGEPVSTITDAEHRKGQAARL